MLTALCFHSSFLMSSFIPYTSHSFCVILDGWRGLVIEELKIWSFWSLMTYTGSKLKVQFSVTLSSFWLSFFFKLLMVFSQSICHDLSRINLHCYLYMLLINMAWFDYQIGERIIFYEKSWLSVFFNSRNKVIYFALR